MDTGTSQEAGTRAATPRGAEHPMSCQWDVIFVVVVTAIRFAFCMWSTAYRVFTFITFFPLDTAASVQAVWNSLHGKFMSQTLLQAEFNVLSYHGSFTSLLMTPILLIYPHGIAGYIFRDIMVTLAVVPVYLLIRAYVSGARERILMFLCYNLAAFLVGFHNIEGSLNLAALPFLVCAYLYYERQQLGAFLACLGLCVLTKESFCFLFAAWSLLALIERRKAIWILLPGLVAAAYFMFYSLARDYYFAPSSQTKFNLFSMYYGVWGNSFGSALLGVVTHPAMALRYLFAPDKWLYLFFVAFPFMPFLLLRPKLLWLAFASFGIAFMMSGRTSEYSNLVLMEELYHPGLIFYYAETCILAFIAFLQFAASSGRKPDKFSLEDAGLVLMLCFLGTCYVFADAVSLYLLAYNNLTECMKPFLVVCMIGVGTIGVIRRLNLSRNHAIVWLATVVIAQSLFHFVFVFRDNMAFAERRLFSLPDEWILRSAAARRILKDVPHEAYLVVQPKYANEVAARTKVSVFEGTGPWSSFKTSFNEEPEYVFFDLMNYNTIYDMTYLNSKWDRSHILAVINDRKNWEIKASCRGLFLLKRRH